VSTSPTPTPRGRSAKLQLLWDFLATLCGDAWASFSGFSRVKQLGIVAVLLTFVGVVFIIDVPSIHLLRSWSVAAGPWFAVVFFVLYVLITQLPLPRTIMTFSSGLLFGPVVGIVIALGATTVSAALSLLIVRFLLGDWMRPRLTHPAVSGINERLRTRGWLAIMSLRMIAAVPFSVLNYAAALSAVPVGAFTMATLLGSAPGTMATVLLGDAATGTRNPAILLVSLMLFVFGMSGLAVDSRLPTRRDVA
jgi:putative membrane protein